ncbi:MAG: glycosyltransferase [Lachnospiraceae bacterium]|nr:glycosyltransferase [Lachnospiraceae bacterium]
MAKKIKEHFSDSKAKMWFGINLICTTVYLLWRVFFTLPFGYGIISMIGGISLLIVEVMGMAEAVVHYVNMYNTRSYEKPEVDSALFPDVDIFIATYNEPETLLEKTIRACKRMDYPDKNKVHIYLCDDAKRAGMKMLAERLEINYLDREDHSGHKAGNLNNALAHSSSPYIVTFDADMLPQSCFLMETIPYFVDAELRNKGREEKDKIKLGFLQTPQSFYDTDLFQFNLHAEKKIPNEQDYFYRDIEVARTRTNSCIYGGSNTVLSREALNDIGGFYTEAITEDFATGILIQKKGYVSMAIGKRLASGVSANTLKALIQQRVRWARGVIATGRKMHIYTSKDLSFGQKVNYWASIWYWYAPIKRFIYIMSPIMYATFGFTIFRCTLWQVLLFWLPMYLSSNISLKYLSNNIRNTKWTSIYEYALFPYMIIPVILESFGVSLKKFKVTEKEKSSVTTSERLVYMIPILILIVLSVIGIVRCIFIMFSSGSLGASVVMFWLIYNLFSMIMCLFFVDGREVYREAERVYVSLEGTLHIGEKTYPFVTKDISETGMAINIDKPILIEERGGEEVYCDIWDRKWHTSLHLNAKHSTEDKKSDNKWLYTFEFDGYRDENSYDGLLAILYDRVPTNPSEIRKRNGVYDDLSTNLERRISTGKVFKRSYPRIRMECKIPAVVDEKDINIKVLDFNYQYFTVKDSECDAKEAVFKIDRYDFKVSLEKKFSHVNLYRIENFDELYPNQKSSDEIMETILKLVEKSKEETKDENEHTPPKNMVSDNTNMTFNEVDVL